MIDQLLRRKAREERYSSPDQLDQAMPVVTPIGWLGLLALGSVLVAAGVWVARGTIYEKVEVRGWLLRGEVQPVQAAAAGRVMKIEVEVDDLVEKGQVMVRLKLTELEEAIEASEGRLDQHLKQRERQDAELRELIQDLESLQEDFQEERLKIEELKRDGLALSGTILAIDSQLADRKAQVFAARNARGELDAKIAEERRNLQQLRASLKSRSLILSPAPGRVTQVLVREDQPIEPGSQVASIGGAEEEPLEAVLWIKLREGKSVKECMPVRITPDTTRREEAGYILAKITSVSEMPETPETHRSWPGADQLLSQLAEERPFEARAFLQLDIAGRIRWSSSKGTELEIESNTPCHAQVITGERRPYEYVIPKLKQFWPDLG